MFDITTIGDIKLDVFVDLGRDAKVSCNLDKSACKMCIDYGVKIPVDSAVTMMAGSAPNIAIGARRLGLKSSIISVVGDDAASTLAFEGLKKEGISPDYVRVQKGSQSSFAAILNFEGESTMLAVHQAFDYKIPTNIKSKWFFVSEMGAKYKELYRELIDCCGKGAHVALNPGASQIEEYDDALLELVKACDLLIVNQSEAKSLTGSPSNDTPVLLDTLKHMGPKTVVITKGKDGAWALHEGVKYHSPMFPGERVEATGAGDSFATGVVSAIIAGYDMPTALTWGAVNAASVVQHVGPQAGLRTLAQLKEDIAGQPSYTVEKVK